MTVAEQPSEWGEHDARRWPGGAVGEQGRKFDAGKPRMDLIPGVALTQLGAVLEYGARKYDEDNWKRHELADGAKRHYGALLRHLVAYKDGEALDPESGLHHLAHALANVVFVLWAENERAAMPTRAREVTTP